MRTIKTILALIAGLLLLLVIWGLIEPRALTVEEEIALIPELPPAWEGRTIAALGDFQLGLPLDNDETVGQAVQIVLEDRPAAVLLLGDYVYHAASDKANQVQRVVELVRPLVDAGIPVYGVLGNHDYSLTSRQGTANTELAERIVTALEGIGVDMLQNEAVVLASPEGEDDPTGAPLYLAGIGSLYAGRDDAQAALAEVPNGAARVAFMHHPESLALFPPSSAPLAIAGHTHGGQFRVPFMPEWSWIALVQEDKVHADGWIDEYGAPGNSLYVNRGIGMSVIPVRFNAPPELTLFELRRAR